MTSTGQNDLLDADSGSTLAGMLAKHQLALPSDQMARLEQYCQNLWAWNQKLNLTRHTDYDKFVTRDLFDSLQLAKLLSDGETVLDVGSGGGVPGVLLAILRADLGVSLCESVAKKANALKAIVESLNLATPVHACRAEMLLKESRFDTLVARAVGPLWKILKWFQPHWDSMGRLLIVKGPKWVEERGEARHRGYLRNLELRRAAVYHTPGTAVENVLLALWRDEQHTPSDNDPNRAR
jgi:16S rRNA (guanine527-N7)-methyltransferase